MQADTQLPTTPPLSGADLVDKLNAIIETLGTNFSGSDDPAAFAWPFATWADTGTGTVKRRNAANSAWVIEGRLFRSHMPIIPAAEVPASDIGPIYIVGVGSAEWVGSGYVPLLASELRAGAVKIATTAEAQALTDDTKALTPKKLGDAMNAHVLGMGQTWQNLTNSRSPGVVYTNTTGRAIVFLFSGEGTDYCAITVDGVLVAVNDFLTEVGVYTLSAIIPAGATYTVTGGVPKISWAELR